MVMGEERTLVDVFVVLVDFDELYTFCLERGYGRRHLVAPESGSSELPESTGASTADARPGSNST